MNFTTADDMPPLLISHMTATSCLGRGLAANLQALRHSRSGLLPCDFESADLDTWTGAVEDVDEVRLPADLRDFDCRNNRLAELGLLQDDFADQVADAVLRLGASRIGVFFGTSTAGILETELAYCRRDARTGALPGDFIYAGTQNPFSLTDYVRRRFGLAGPAMSISSACSSSAKVFGTAQRMIASGLIDAALVGGVDSLCLTTLCGFRSLELLSAQPCRPFDARRDGISIGEAAAFIMLERCPAQPPADALLLRGVGESSDAYHMSSPHPDGLGAAMAMQSALTQAGLAASQIDYVNLHGTATPGNDAAEAKAVAGIFGLTVPCSSTKGATGHTLGAAGAIEAVLSALTLRHGFLPGGVGTDSFDPSLAGPLNYLLASQNLSCRTVLSNSFGFGGTNCSLILGLEA